MFLLLFKLRFSSAADEEGCAEVKGLSERSCLGVNNSKTLLLENLKRFLLLKVFSVHHVGFTDHRRRSA